MAPDPRHTRPALSTAASPKADHMIPRAWWRIAPVSLLFLAACTTEPGVTDSVLRLDGVDDYAQAAPSAALEIGTGDFTLELRFQRERSGIREDLLTKKDLDADSEHDLAVGITEGGQPYGYLRSTRFEQARWLLAAAPVPDGWHHLALTRSAGQVTLYVDGVAVASAASTADVTSTGPFRIGGNRPEYSGPDAAVLYPFQGRVDEVRVWDVARSASQIQAAMDGSPGQWGSRLVAYYDFNENGAATAAEDRTGQTGPAQLRNGATRETLDGGDPVP
jgi:hypothetical protein